MRLLPTRRRAVTILVLLTAYALVMLFGGCADRLLLYPSTQPIRVGGVSRLQVPSPKGGMVEVWVARSEGAEGREPQAFVLQFNGNASRAEPMAAYVAREWGGRPVEVWAVNFPGYGGSTGPTKLASIPPKSLAAYDELKRKAAGRPIFVEGQSMGTTAALHVAANRPVAGVVLAKPPPLRDMILRHHGWWNLWLLAGPIAVQVPSEMDSLRNARRVKAPAVFVLSGRDEVVPPVYQQKVARAYAGETRLVTQADADHNAPLEAEAAIEFQAALDWLWSETVGPPPATDPLTPPAAAKAPPDSAPTARP